MKTGLKTEHASHCVLHRQGRECTCDLVPSAMLREIAKAMRDRYDAAYIERRAAELEQQFSNDVTNRE